MAATEAMAAANTFASLPQVPNRKTTTTMKRTSPTKNTANRHFAQLERRIADDGTGPRRLRDGAIVVDGTGTTNRRTPTRKRSKMTPHGDGSSSSNSGTNWIEGLVSSTTDRTTSARTMRQGWRQAVESAYEQNQASARVAAAVAQCTTTNTHHPPIEWTRTTTSTTDTAGSSPQQQLKVVYQKGVQGRGVYTDVVDFIEYDVLVAAIGEIYPSQALRSFHLALLSPRVFWSLVYHYNNYNQQNHTTGTTTTTTSTNNPHSSSGDVIQDALKWSCPDLDWTYLRRRPEQLSEKALENLRQEHERSNQNPTMDWEAAAAAILSVEQSMDDMMVQTRNDADLSLLSSSNPSTSAPITTDNHHDWQWRRDTNSDLSELIECINSYEADSITGSIDTTENDVIFYPMNHIVYALTQKLKLSNYYDLANVPDRPPELYDRLKKVLSDVDQRPVPHILPVNENNETVEVTAAAIEQWIESAQEMAVYFSMTLICNDDTTMVDILTETLRCSTPRDLIFWESVPGLCVEQIRNRWRDVAVAEKLSPTQMHEWERTIEEHVTESNILKFCRRAHITLEQVTWMNDYVTAIEYE